MNLALLLPSALLALAALVLPLLLHRVRRTEQRPVLFAALRWLQTSERPQRRHRFDEWLLLALRLVLLALIALWLAQPVLRGDRDARPWLLVVPGADPALAPAMPDKAHRRWLAPGLPSLDAAPTPSTDSIASLLRQADAQIPQGAAITVLAPERLGRTDAGTLRLSRPVRWQVVPGNDGAATANTRTQLLAVVHEAAHARALPYLRAAGAAWTQQRMPLRLQMAEAASWPSQAQGLVWLKAGEVPAAVVDWARAGRTVLLPQDARWPDAAAVSHVALWRDAEGELIADVLADRGARIVQLRVPMQPASLPMLLEPDFAQALAEVLLPTTQPPALASARAYAPSSGAARDPDPPRPLRDWLAVVIAGVFALERVLALRATRHGAAR